jgi:trigger factor
MDSKLEKLPHSRIKVLITAKAGDLQHAAEHAFAHATGHVSVKGFRPGKAPKPMLVQAAGKGRILSELADHALPELLQQAVKEHKVTVIQSPSYSLEKVCELNDDGTVKEDTELVFSAEADIVPEVKVGDYKKLKIKPTEPEEVTDEVVNEILNQLADRKAEWNKVDRAAKKDDRVEIDFAGKRGGIPEDRLASTNYPIVIGSNMMIPGFEDELIGKKAGDSHTFEVTFPADYHAKDLANEKVVFTVKIHDVSEKKLPAMDDTFAKNFGHKTLDELKDAIKKEREFTFAGQAKEANEAAVLEEFLKLVTVDVPKSLVERELDRQIDMMRQQAQSMGLTFDNYLKHIKKTEEEMRDEMRPTAEKAVAIGLGLGEVVKGEEIKDNDPGVAAIAKLVEIATWSDADSPSKKK